MLSRLIRPALLAPLLVSGLGWHAPALAQGEVEDIFKDLGTATTVEEGEPEDELAAGNGVVVGRVFDLDSGVPLRDVTVIMLWPAPEDGGKREQELATTAADGSYEFSNVPAGRYTLTFVKSGYRASSMTQFEVVAGEINRGDFPMPPVPADQTGEVMQLDEFVVEASTVGELMDKLELRLESDQLVNIMSAEDLSRFAASDVADALKRVAGVNIVEGQFAIIRGLEDRYSATVYNRAPVPSPDPDRQSPQLDLFPSDIVDNLVVSKTFAPHLPGNSSGGAIDIVTHQYAEGTQIKVSAGTGYHQGALDRFLGYQSFSSIGEEASRSDTIEEDYGFSINGQRTVADRNVRFKALYNWEVDYSTKEGFFENREPARPFLPRSRRGRPTRQAIPGDLNQGLLSLSGGRYDVLESTFEEQATSYLGFGFDLDPAGSHTLDASIFFTKKREEVVTESSNGFVPGLDYAALRADQEAGGEINISSFCDRICTNTAFAQGIRGTANETPANGPLWSSAFFNSESFERERDLFVHQINGSHDLDRLTEGLTVDWSWNHATTTQNEEFRGAEYFYEPDDTTSFPSSIPSSIAELGEGAFYLDGPSFSVNDIDETQDFARIDAEYALSPFAFLDVELRAGAYWERARRGVDAQFLESPTADGSTQFTIEGDTQGELGNAINAGLDTDEFGEFSGQRRNQNDSRREIGAYHGGLKLTLLEDLDLLGGYRLEKIHIESNNDPFTGEPALDGSPAIFPSKYVLFDRLDSASEGISSLPEDATFNDQILGIDVPVGADGKVNLATEDEIRSFVNGRIKKTEVLPAFGVTYRPLDFLTLRGAWSKTVARPSFREMGYYVTTEAFSSDKIVGNPQLGLSDVESFDLRAELTWGDVGDLFAVSLFQKKIDRPIESIVVRDPLNAEASNSALFRTFFNNPDQADLKGFEVEARKNLGFLHPWLDYLSLGGNYTFIEAEVSRTPAELARAQAFFGSPDGFPDQYIELNPKRRLFGQPEWIANADISFDQPEWGTKITLAWFAISDVLDAAGSASTNFAGDVISIELDRYIDSFHQLDLVFSQELFEGLVFKASLKNLTDSRRRVIYDPSQTASTVVQREFRRGRDYAFSISYRFEF